MKVTGRGDAMDRYLITGGQPLKGKVRAGGNKNAALPCIAAALLTGETVELHRIPDIQDVSVMLDIARDLGAAITRPAPGIAVITPKILSRDIPGHLAQAIRASILFSAPVLVAHGRIILPPPGGDVIGHRRLDTHFQVYHAFGGRAEIGDDGNISITLPKLLPADLLLDESSVTATENALMLAAACRGTSVISNAAAEPHVQDLCRMLVLMGARIEGIGSNLLTVTGSSELGGCSYTIGVDYMEVGSYIGLAAAVGGNITIQGVEKQHLRIIQGGCRKLGIPWSLAGDELTISDGGSRDIPPGVGGHIPKIDDAPWPGFPTDLLSIMTVTATQYRGTVLIHEKMFESRLFYLDTLIKMGARIIICDPHRAVVTGPSRLHGQVMASPDVRAGMALMIAALCAEGESEIQNIYQIERGYEQIFEKLQSLGAHIRRG